MVATAAKRCLKQLAGQAFGHLDSPTDGLVVSGMLRVQGWVVDPTGLDGSIELMVDGRPLPNALERQPRPDVRAVFVNETGTTGFSANVHTAQFPDGHHGLSCVVRKAGTETIVATRTFQSRNCPRSFFSCWYLRGSGLEIGALHNPLGVPPGCKVVYVDRMNVHDLRLHYPELADKPLVDVDVVDDGEKLTTIADSSQDFIIANHFIEHAQDPIGTIKRHLEVLAPAGMLYLAVPDKRLTFDRRRPVTALEHLYRDYHDGPAWSYMDHVREWASLVANLEGEAAEAETRRLVDTQYSIHFHVWTQNELLEFLVDIRKNLALPFDIVSIAQNGLESIVLLKKWPAL